MKVAARSRAVIVLSSQVARGGVGNRAAVFALELLGLTVWQVPTVLLPYHPGHGRGTRIETDPEQFGALLNDLLQSQWIGEVGAVLTGYFANAAQVSEAAGFIAALATCQPVLVACDPIIGDQSGLYVGKPVAEAIRDLLMPLAAIATPNRHELAWLTDSDIADLPQAASAARRLDPETVLVTSAPVAEKGKTGNLLVSANAALLASHRLIAGPPNGAGDLTAALFLGHRLRGHGPKTALARATAAVVDCIEAAARRGSEELTLAQDWRWLLKPGSRPRIAAIADAEPAVS